MRPSEPFAHFFGLNQEVVVFGSETCLLFRRHLLQLAHLWEQFVNVALHELNVLVELFVKAPEVLA